MLFIYPRRCWKYLDVADAEDLRDRSRGAGELKHQDLQKNRKNLPMMISTVFFMYLYISSSFNIDVGDTIIMSKIITMTLF